MKLILFIFTIILASHSQLLASAGDNPLTMEMPDPTRIEDKALIQDQMKFMDQGNSESNEFVLPSVDVSPALQNENEAQSQMSYNGNPNMNFKESSSFNLEDTLNSQVNLASLNEISSQNQIQSQAQDALEAQAMNLIKAREESTNGIISGEVEADHTKAELEAQAKAIIDSQEKERNAVSHMAAMANELNLEGKKIKIDQRTVFEFDGQSVKVAEILEFYRKFKKVCGSDFSVCNKIIKDFSNHKQEAPQEKKEEMTAPRLKAKSDSKKIEWETPLIKGKGLRG